MVLLQLFCLGGYDGDALECLFTRDCSLCVVRLNVRVSALGGGADGVAEDVPADDWEVLQLIRLQIPVLQNRNVQGTVCSTQSGRDPQGCRLDECLRLMLCWYSTFCLGVCSRCCG